jgi:hypothetical protein
MSAPRKTHEALRRTQRRMARLFPAKPRRSNPGPSWQSAGPGDFAGEKCCPEDMPLESAGGDGIAKQLNDIKVRSTRRRCGNGQKSTRL